MVKPRTNYTKEFKLAILSQIQNGVPIAQVARENGLCPSLVGRWKKEFKENPETAFSGPGHPYKELLQDAEVRGGILERIHYIRRRNREPGTVHRKRVQRKTNAQLARISITNRIRATGGKKLYHS